MYTFRRVQNDEDVIRTMRLRHQVYREEKGWFVTDHDEDRLERDRFDKHSHHYLACDSENGVLIGSARLILNSQEEGMQISAHPGPVRFDDFTNCAEISRLIAASEHRRGVIMLGLIRMIYVHVITEFNHLRYLYIGVDSSFHKILRMLGFDFVQIGNPELCYGDELVAARMSVPEMDHHVEKVNRRFHHWLYEPPDRIDDSINLRSFMRRTRI